MKRKGGFDGCLGAVRRKHAKTEVWLDKMIPRDLKLLHSYIQGPSRKIRDLDQSNVIRNFKAKKTHDKRRFLY